MAPESKRYQYDLILLQKGNLTDNRAQTNESVYRV